MTITCYSGEMTPFFKLSRALDDIKNRFLAGETSAERFTQDLKAFVHVADFAATHRATTKEERAALLSLAAKATLANAAQNPRAPSFDTGYQMFGCPTNTESFKTQCRIPLFRGKWNTWIVRRTLEDQVTRDDDLAKYVKATFYQWFKKADFKAQYHDVQVTDLTDWDKKETDPWGQVNWKLKANTLERVDSKLVKNLGNMDCQNQPVPTVRGPKTTEVAVQFVYRGDQDSFPWPVWKAQVFDPWCPVDADYVVAEVYEGKLIDKGGKEVPEPPAISIPVPGIDPGDVDKVVKAAGEGLYDLGVKVAIGAGLGLVLLIGVSRAIK